MWKKTLLGALIAALIALPVFAAENAYTIVQSEETSAVTVDKPILAGNTTPIQNGVTQVRVTTKTAAAWIYFQNTPLGLNAANLNGRMSEFATNVPTGVPTFLIVAPGMRWHVQGDGGTAVVTVTQISK